MLLSTNPTFEMKKLKKQFSEIGHIHIRKSSAGSAIPTKFSTLHSPDPARTDLCSADGDIS